MLNHLMYLLEVPLDVLTSARFEEILLKSCHPIFIEAVPLLMINFNNFGVHLKVTYCVVKHFNDFGVH